jgi:hypothetical protein
MKKCLLASVLFMGVFISCKKDNSSITTSAYGITANINGKPVTLYHTVQVDTSNGLHIQAAIDSSVNSDIIWISIDGGRLHPGTYSYLSNITGTATYFMNHQGVASPFLSYNATVTVTSVDNSGIKGSFQGTGAHYSQNERGVTVIDSTIIITNGSFNVKIPRP